MRALMARARGAEGGLLRVRWKSQLLVLLVLLIRTNVESSAADKSAKSERGLMVVTHTSGETRQKRAGDEGRLGMLVRSDIWKL